ncbi:chaperone protein DnaJ [bacterium MnTg02]|nr:chaperone protein DnaJ [bacterium MnTg02]
MKLNSKYFDSIRVKPEASARKDVPICDWPGCAVRGGHRAPRGRGRDGEYFLFCIEHVRAYNKTYNYFSGMSDEEVAKFQKAAVTGHRPTWSVGVNSKRFQGPTNASEENTAEPNGFPSGIAADDVYGLFGDGGSFANKNNADKRRPIRNLERKSLRALSLDDSATREDIRSRFKALVKRHHPDLNDGDRESEDRLREIIQAYNYLKQSGLC